MLDGPKVSHLERQASIQGAGRGMATASVWSLAAVHSEGRDQQGSSQRAKHWELGGGERDSWCPGAGASSRL